MEEKNWEKKGKETTPLKNLMTKVKWKILQGDWFEE